MDVKGTDVGVNFFYCDEHPPGAGRELIRIVFNLFLFCKQCLVGEKLFFKKIVFYRKYFSREN